MPRSIRDDMTFARVLTAADWRTGILIIAEYREEIENRCCAIACSEVEADEGRHGTDLQERIRKAIFREIEEDCRDATPL